MAHDLDGLFAIDAEWLHLLQSFLACPVLLKVLQWVNAIVSLLDGCVEIGIQELLLLQLLAYAPGLCLVLEVVIQLV